MLDKFKVGVVCVWLGLVPAGLTAAEPPTREQIWQTLQQQQRQIEDLRRMQERTNRAVEETGKAVEATADAVKETGAGKRGWWERTSLGGYGELHYNGGDTDQIDFHRFVLFIGHEFTDRIRLASELELEHAVTSDTADGSGAGEIELEQAYLEYDVTDRLSAKVGLFLVPAGILNEVHEPPTFFGVERNRVENAMIPTTWWEAGAGAAYTFGGGLRVDGLIHSGLDVPTTGSDAFKVRNGRQKVAKATLRDPALTGRIRYTGMPGVELASTLQYQFDVTQGDAGDPETAATLWEVHADLKRAVGDKTTAGLRTLYARWDLDGTAAEVVGRDEQYGWYVEPSLIYDFGEQALGVFARYSVDDNTAGDGADSKFAMITVGLNFWLHRNAALKLDFDFQQPPEGTARDNRLNLGVGFQF
jgi:hypothetical protein